MTTHPETGALHKLRKVTLAPSFSPRNIRREAVCSVHRGGGPQASVSSKGSSTPLWIPPHSLPSSLLCFISHFCLQTLGITSLANLWSGPHLGEYWCRHFIWDFKMCVTGGYDQRSSVSGSETQHWNLCSFGLCLFWPSWDLSLVLLSLVEFNSNSVLKMDLEENKQNVRFHYHANFFFCLSEFFAVEESFLNISLVGESPFKIDNKACSLLCTVCLTQFRNMSLVQQTGHWCHWWMSQRRSPVSLPPSQGCSAVCNTPAALLPTPLIITSPSQSQSYSL